MTIDRTPENLLSLLRELTGLPNETEWCEFKQNNENPEMIGEYISALANSAALIEKQFGYIVWGIEDISHRILGTLFRPSLTRHKNQELESWLLQKITPKIHFRFFEFLNKEQKNIVILEIQAATHTPVQFDGIEFIRVGSSKKKLRTFPEKERELWRVFDKVHFEQQLAVENISSEQVLKLLDYPSYFELTNQPLPEGREGVLSSLLADGLLKNGNGGTWNITNLGAVLFAKELKKFKHLERKAVRLISYHGNDRLETIKEIPIIKGYAVAFDGLIESIQTLLPTNEIIKRALRKDTSMYPSLAIRELVANALIHQDFNLSGTGPMIEIFSHRLEITNPGTPLVDPERFLDSPPRSRNERIASLLRRIGICEERGSGIDKVVIQTEIYQLPAPLFESHKEHTRCVLFAYRNFNKMDKGERVRATYLHSVLKYLKHESMTNATLRERFGIEEKNKATISRIIKQATDSGKIKVYDVNAGTKSMRYVPWWA